MNTYFKNIIECTCKKGDDRLVIYQNQLMDFVQGVTNFARLIYPKTQVSPGANPTSAQGAVHLYSPTDGVGLSLLRRASEMSPGSPH